MPMPDKFQSADTAQCNSLIQAKACSPTVARLLGLLFANRDLELIDLLEISTDFPDPDDLPSADTVAAVLGVEKRWADFQLEKMRRFLHKRNLNGDFSADIRDFSNRPDVVALAPACRKLKAGLTVFIGDSLMAIRHFSANASFPILAGSFLKSLDVGPFINAGIGGQTTAQGLARFARDVLAHNPARVIFSFGSNDLANGVPIDLICHNFESMVRPAQNQGADIVLGLILPVMTERLWWSPEPLRNATLEDRRPLQAAMTTLAQRHGIPCLDLLDQLAPAHYCIDGIHLNQSGQERCALETLGLLSA
jgi:lysophospholipase L1-like esterase